MARATIPTERMPLITIEESSPALQKLMINTGTLLTEELVDLDRRAASYLDAGYPLHLRGPAGSGKTTMALRVAERIKRPIILLVGDASFNTRRLVGSEETTRTKRVVDRYISSVTKVESQTDAVWLDRALTMACIEGATLVYDEFNRAPASANNVLLTVLEERLLVLAKPGRGETYQPVHPQFRAIFTSNPTDHVGANLTQDALTDRMITLDLEYFDRDTEISIVSARSGMKIRDSSRIVDTVRDFRASRSYTQRPTLRASIMIARIACEMNLRVSADEKYFVQVCLDVLGSKLKTDENGMPDSQQRQLLIQLIEHFCAPDQTNAVRTRHGVAA
jgi:gas vesicle protein GvpN